MVTLSGPPDPNGIYVIDPNGAGISVYVCCSNCFSLIGMPIYPSPGSKQTINVYFIFRIYLIFPNNYFHSVIICDIYIYTIIYSYLCIFISHYKHK